MAQESALAKVINGNGQNLSEKQAKGALAEAMDKLGREGGKLSKLKDNMGNLGDALIYTGETQGTVFIASFAEGYLGEEKMDIGPVDLRLAGGIVTAGYGFYNVMSGKGGEHALAVGNGLLATGISRVGRNAGKALAEKKDKGNQKDDKPAAAGTAAAPAPAEPRPKAVTDGGGTTTTDGDFGELVRDIFLTPDGDTAEGRRERRGILRRRRRRQRRKNRRQRRRGRKHVRWGKTALSGESNTPDNAGDQITINIRPQHWFRAQDITFTGDASAKVDTIFFGDRPIWNNSVGTPVAVFASTGMLRGILNGQKIRPGLDIIIKGTSGTAATRTTATLIGYKPLNTTC